MEKSRGKKERVWLNLVCCNKINLLGPRSMKMSFALWEDEDQMTGLPLEVLCDETTVVHVEAMGEEGEIFPHEDK